MRLRYLLFVLMLASPLAARAQREKFSDDDLVWLEKNFPDAKKSNTGIRYVVIEKGAGEPARRGDMVSVLYVGRLISGRTFDQNNNPDHPLKFRLGRDDVIQGWDQILQLMRPGDRWVVIIPPELAYGTRGNPPTIPGNATLVFMMQLLAVKRE
ncbi:MAG: FKBP-type peptidyl-prolyl cis-trans isomerase [Opitutales bacterium]